MKKYDTLFSLLESLVTRKMSVNSANADQISFIINLMHGYSDERLCGTEEVKSEFLHKTTLTKAKNVILNTKNNPKKEIKRFFPKTFNEYILKEQTNVLLNVMQLYNYRNKIIRLFENKNIRPSMSAYNAKSEPKEYDEAERSEQKFNNSIGERVKLKRQKADDKKDETGDELLDTTDMPELESEESAEQRR